jgi:hypothetical protein
MKLHTRGSAITELLLILPIFLGLAFMIGWIGFLQIQRTELEKLAWNTQTQKTYGYSLHALDKKYKINSSSFLGTFIQEYNPDVPRAFHLFIGLHPVKSEKLVLQGQIPSIFENFFRAAFNERGNIRKFTLTANLFSSGSPMNRSWITKLALWQESMNASGFQYPLYMLGIPELLSVPGIPSSILGDFQKLLKAKHTIKNKGRQ